MKRRDFLKAAGGGALAAATASGTASPSETVKVISEWQRGSAERIAEDLREWMDLGQRCSAEVTSAAVKSEAASIGAAADTVASAAKQDHAIPV